MQWEAIINAIICPRARAASQLGLDIEELRAVGRLAALEAQATWRPGAGATASSWVWTHVAGRVSKLLYKASRELAADTPEQDDGCDLEAEAIVRETLSRLRAELDPSDYRLLWFSHAMGFTAAELAELYGVPWPAMRQRLCRAKQRAVTILRLAA